MRINKIDFEILQWLINSYKIKDIRQAYQNKSKRKNRSKRRNKQNTYCKWIENTLSYEFGQRHPHEIDLFGRTLTNEERERYFGPPYNKKKHNRNRRKNRRKKKNNEDENTALALNISDDMKHRRHISYKDLENGWIIDSGASAHMTPYKSDCQTTYPVLRQVFMADGSSIICKLAGEITIPIYNKKQIYLLKLKDVFINTSSTSQGALFGQFCPQPKF